MIATKSIKWLLDDYCIYHATSSGYHEINVVELAGNLAYHAMMLEAHLTPKAGLVDCVSTGAHRDMDINTFIASSNALRPYMKLFVKTGCDMHDMPTSELLSSLRPIGLAAEEAMFEATHGVNTHKGMIFTLGLICGAVGWLYKNQRDCDAFNIRNIIRQCCSGLVQNELKEKPSDTKMTAGERLFKLHGLTGIRGEAGLGYPTIFNFGLPLYQTLISQGNSEEQALSQTLLSIMSVNNDTNLVNRGGLAGLAFVQQEAKCLLLKWQSILISEEREQDILMFDSQLVSKNLSPGGSADLLAATWLLAQFNRCCKG